MAERGREDGATERLHGSIERVTFHSEETGFCVLRVRVRGRAEHATVVGKAASVRPGEFVEATGHWQRDRQHGLQFRAGELRIVAPSTREGIERYLASGMIRGAGPHFARKLVEAFGERVFEVIEQEPERLRQLPGVGPKRASRLIQAWSEQRAVRDIMVFLQSHGVGTARAFRIYKAYGDDAVERVTENPYRLALDVHGIGFLSADRIARQVGIALDSPIRARAGVRHVLQEHAGQGHCAVFVARLREDTSRLLEIPEDAVDAAIRAEAEDASIVLDPIAGEPAAWLARLHVAEVGIAAEVARLEAGDPPWGRQLDVARAIPWVAERTGIRLAPSQRHAVEVALRNKITVVTGGPGVGKTTLVHSLLRIVQAKKVEPVLCAPTGRAAKRMSESTGLEARTIHRLLEFDPKTGAFQRDRDRPISGDLIVLDEASMVDVALMHALLRAIPSDAALWIVGDVDQIPSVGPGHVLGDLIASERIPTVRLTEIFRQAAQSSIVVNAHRIHAGEMPALGEPRDGGGDFFVVPAESPEDVAAKLFELVVHRIPRRFGVDARRDVHVLTPMNRGDLGTRALNAALQERLNPGGRPRIDRLGTTWAVGDKVLQTVNDYDKDVFNGDVGIIGDIDVGDATMTVRFDDRDVLYGFQELDELTLAYATTIHKAQGSEYPAVVLVLSTQHYTMLDRNLLYTAVTRGRELVVVVAQTKALGLAVRTARTRRRTTDLAARLRR
jgi:exodeoxyribonuclease V alpha subunit